MEAQFWQPPVSDYSPPPRQTDTEQDLVLYILKEGDAYESDDASGTGHGWGGGVAKWKHVIQELLNCNLARHKKGTHIIIKSSQGKRETTNIIPAPPQHHTSRTVSNSPLFISPLDDREDGKIGAVFA